MSKRRDMLGWHFTDEHERLRYGDGRKIEVGVTHEVECKPVLCQSGLHASKTVLDALLYAPGHILYRVRLSGKIVHDIDKSVATKRTYIARLNAEKTLRQFARECALDVIHLWDCPQIVRDYLTSGDDKLRAAARDAARAAARDAARDAAWAAAWDAAWDAARAAACAAANAWDAAGAAAGDAAGDAAWDAAGAAARAAQKTKLEKMVRVAIKNENH